MNARVILRSACAASLFAVLVGCGSDDNGQPATEDGGDATTGMGGSGEGGTDVAAADGMRADATSEASADSAGNGGLDSTLSDGGGQDSTVTDGGTAETEGQDSTATDTGVGDATTEASVADSGTEDGGTDGADTSVDGGVEAAADSASDAERDTGAGQGPACRASDGGIYRCNAGEHCCANAMTQASSCATSCDPSGGTYPVDCAGATGDGQCGSQLCCGTLVLDGGTVPNCGASELTSACAASCGGDAGDNPPGVFSNCMGSYTIRLCNATADCASDPGRPVCCKFGASPVYWCVDTITQAVAANCFM